MPDFHPFWADFDKLGSERVRQDLGGIGYGEERVNQARAWLEHQESLSALSDRAKTLDEAKAANVLARMANDLAREANAVASSANTVALDAATSARDSAAAAKTNNIIATAALIAAVIAIAISVIGVFLQSRGK